MKNGIERILHNRILLLACALFRLTGGRKRLFSFLEQAATAVALLFALQGFIAVDMPYAVFLFSGLAPWYYLKEVLFAIFDQPARTRSLFGADGYASSWLPVGHSLAALPTLLLWTVICILLALLLLRAPLARIFLVGYFIICSVFNAAAQGMFAAAFLPLFPAKAEEGISITMPFIFWTAPIAWPVAQTLSGIFLFLMRLNPLYYLADCLRGILVNGMLPPLEHAAIFFASVAFVGLLGQLCLRRVWKSSAALW